ncbi:M28 family peptidase [Occallatibacter savannae]|uniref:M28 family peptidase n=1 Tax=Occallatibacter savannae TaxID=1002691 RepID=UPI000D693AEA|nr:M28 family peptidase [Occallatibacter savannae]
MKILLRCLAPLTLLAASLPSPAQQTWTVKPEWVTAHEYFLSSDVLAGRGSATRDEELAATYVASEFESYGLKTAPGMKGYLQSADIVAPKLDGHASLQIGDSTLEEGKDFFLFASPGTSASAKLVHVAAAQTPRAEIPAGSAVLVTGAADPKSLMPAVSALYRSGAAIVLAPETPALSALPQMVGGETRVSVRLADDPPRKTPTIILIHTDAASKLPAADGAQIVVSVHDTPQAKPRQTFNAIGYLPGTDPSAGTLLLSAHLDHLGIGRPVDGDSIYNGANDDAAGTTAVLELAHALASGAPLRRSVLFVCYGAEEIGELGSTYFGKHPPVPLHDLIANLEFEMIGNQDPKMPAGILMLTGWERSNLGPTLKEHGALLGPDPYPEQHFFERSDNYALALQGVVAHTAGGWGTPPTYHRPDDDLQHLDIAFMTRAIQSLIEPVRWLAASDFRPQWNPGGDPSSKK